MMRQFDDADQAVSWAAILLFIDAALDGLNILVRLVSAPEDLVTAPGLLFLALVAGKVAAGAGLLKSRRWAWPLGLAVIGVDILLALWTLPGSILRLLFDAAVVYLLLRPAVRERFGQR
ncbi:MAG TPA: hypothetical protein VKG45_09535 [Actinomycetes bacterium]|nr:hypothetical protein [Actinomycetes bacterium]